MSVQLKRTQCLELYVATFIFLDFHGMPKDNALFLLKSQVVKKMCYTFENELILFQQSQQFTLIIDNLDEALDREIFFGQIVFFSVKLLIPMQLEKVRNYDLT